MATKYDDLEVELLRKIDAGENLTEEELRLVIHDFGFESEYEENRRWTRCVSTISELCGRYFMTVWDEGLTECQENEYYDQPEEVELVEYEKTITVREWKRKEQQNRK